jgi:hypothetical protein
VAVGDSDTIRAGADLMVTAPLPAVTVTGKLAADAELAAEALLAAGVPLTADEVDEVLLADDPQPARTAAQAAAVPSAAVILRGVLIEGYFLPNVRERKARPLACLDSTPRRPGRIALPTRADIVRRAVVDLAWTPGGSSQLRDSAGF